MCAAKHEAMSSSGKSCDGRATLKVKAARKLFGSSLAASSHNLCHEVAINVLTPSIA